MKQGKKYRQALEKYNVREQYSLDQALVLVKSLAYAKFDETVEIALKLNVKTKHSIRDTLVLPNGFRAEKKILVFAKGEKAEEAKEAGAVYVGDTDLIEKIRGGMARFRCGRGHTGYDERCRQTRPNPRSSGNDAQSENEDRHLRHQRGDRGAEEGAG